MDPFNYSVDVHGQFNRYCQLASEDKLTKDDLDKFSNLIQRSHAQLTHEERTKLLDLGKTIELSSHSILGKMGSMVSGLFHHSIYGNPKFTEIIDIIELNEIIDAIELPDANPKKYNSDSLKKLTDFVLKIKEHRLGEEVLYELAKRCAQQDGWGTAQNIKNFGIKDKAALAEIAKLCAQEHAVGTIYFLGNFEIKDQATLIEIAKLCAQQQGRATAEAIKKFGIEDRAALVEIAKLCAQQHGSGTAEYIHKFGIKDKHVLAEIAKLCAQQNGWGTAHYIKNFGIKNDRTLYRLLNVCVTQNTDVFFLIGNFSPLPRNLEKLSGLVKVLKSNEEEKNRRIQLFEAIDKLIEGLACAEDHKKAIKKSSGEIAKLAFHTQRAAVLWLLQSLVLMVRAEPEAIDWMVENGMWSELSNLRQPNLRSYLTPGLFNLAGSGENRKEWDTILSSQMGRKGMRLMAISLYGLQQQGANKGLLMEFAQHLSQLRISRDALKIQLLLHITHLLSSTTILTPEQKSSGFVKIFPKIGKDRTLYEKQILQNAKAAKGLLQLKESQWVDSEENLSGLFCSGFEKLIPLNDFNGDASLKYDQIFASSRDPSDLLTYAAGLKTLNEPAVMDCLGRYVASVFNGTFKEMRYDTKNNPHLAKIFEARPDLREKWKNATSEFAHDLKGILVALEKSQEEITGKKILRVVISDDPIDLLLAGTDVTGSCQRLDGTPNLNKGLLGYLMDGKNRLLAIKDKSGKIVARCMLSLLWDGKQPVLYRERFYPDTIAAKEAEALNNIAIKFAKELAVPLTAGGEGAPYGKALKALGGPAPYDYSDGSGGVQKEGCYKIMGARLVAS